MDEPAVLHKTGPLGHAATGGALTRPGLELCIGSNTFRSTNGVVTIHEKEQVVIETNRAHGLFLITLDLYDAHGTRIAHLRRNTLTLNEKERFAVEVHFGQSLSAVESPSVRLTDLQSGGIVLSAAMTSEHKVALLFGKFYSHRGVEVEITPHYCRIGSGKTLFGDIVESRGGPAILG
ncbi:MAG: hypothetical protein OEV99_12480 [Nitrospira sp.]|nr:hypothetical protein [Nitrospira sp.]MDH4370645.1 hypothetical protein [Nitrospira sp.]MDH5496971.1 hypothetical protein [Nitrospira sp.]MDH5726072.1 hypothetical protein [Nitrospira sp.]